MSPRSAYETLEADVMKDVTAYLDAVENFEYEQVGEMDSQVPLYSAFAKSVESNARYLCFFAEHKQAEI